LQPITTCIPRKAIIHVLDNSTNTLITSDYVLDINSDVEEYLKKHIMKTLHDDKTRVAQFNHPGINIVQTSCQAIFANPSQFVAQSKNIAQHLFTIMSANKTISSADLVICLYEGDDHPYIAILKMDYNDTYIHDFAATPEAGRIKLTIKKGTTSLPHPNQKLQKAVFVQQSTDDAPYDFVVLDKQINNKDTEDDIALFFLKLFLNGTVISRDRDKTVELIDLTRKWIAQSAEPNEANQIISIIGNTLADEEFVPAQTLSETVFPPGSPLFAKKEEYESYLSEQGFNDMNFSVDSETAHKQLKRLKWVTEEGIEIIIKNPVNADKVSVTTDLAGNTSIMISGVRLAP
jgi:hypothetical protein